MRELSERLANLAVVSRYATEKAKALSLPNNHPDMSQWSLDEIEGYVADILEINIPSNSDRMSYHEYIEFSSLEEYKKFRGLPPVQFSAEAISDIMSGIGE